MRLHRALILLGIMILINGISYAQPPLKIPYQAVIRTPEGEILANQPAVIRTSIILGQPTNDAVFSETHSVTSNPFGVVSLVLGNGAAVTGNFDEINWKAGVAFLKIEIDYQNTGSYALIGVSQILSVPYALKSGNSLEQLSGQQGQIISHDGGDWQAYDKVWVNPGVVTVDGAPTKNPEDPIFQIKNQAGEVLFTVNSQGVEVKLADSGEEQGSLRVQGLSATEPFLVISPDSALVQFNTDGTRAEKGGFAVGGLSSGKPVSTPYFMLEPAMATLNFDKAAAIKAEKGGFAVGGLSSGKTVTSIFTIEQDCTRMYIASELERAEKGGFAVGGLSSGKPLGQEYFRLSSLGAQVTFDEDLQRAEKGGFAVGGLSNGKTIARDYLNLSQEQVKFSMAERDEKSGLGGFTIGGYMDNGEQYTSFFNLNPISVIINTGSVTTGEIVIGGDVNVGGEIIFQPEVSTDFYAEVTETTALAFGTLYSDGGGAISAFGFVWDTLPETTVERYLGQCVMPEVQFLPFWCQLNGLDSATTYYVRAFATNSAGTAYGSEFEFTTLTGWEDKPTATVPSVSDITDYSALFLTMVENPFAITMISKGFVVNLTGNPTRSVNNGMFETEALEAGELSGEISDLMADTLYYARAFVKFYADEENGIEATFYSEQTTFRTQPSPWVVSGEILAYNDISATLSATLYIPDNVTQDAFGFVWNTSGNPDFDSGNYTGTVDFYESPQTPHVFEGTLSGLEPNTTYYVKPYVYNYHGYSYGETRTVTTLPAPTVSTGEILGFGYDWVKVNGTVTMNEHSSVTKVGFIWGLNENTTFEGEFVDYSQNFEFTLTFTDSITGLTEGTTYHIRAYIETEYGTTYGVEKSFTTKSFPSANITSITNITQTSATVDYTLIDCEADVTGFGLVWGEYPEIENDGTHFTFTSYEGQTGFSETITDLNPGIKYYVRPYVEFTTFDSESNPINNTNYGDADSLETIPLPPVVIDTIDATTFYSAWAHATINITDILTSKVGFIWSQNEEFTHASASDTTEMVWGSMGGTFNLELEWLHPGTQYYVKAFIITENNDTLYSASYGFTTQPSPVITNPVDEPTSDGAFVTAMIGYPEYQYPNRGGFVWGTTPDIDLANNIDSCQLGYVAPETFHYLITGLTENTEYYVKAWAEILDSIYYGEAQPFTTQPVYGTVTDASGNEYPTKYIGRYSWMTQNLRTLKYSDGTDLPFETDYREPANPDSLVPFGRLYSFNAVLRHHTHQLNSKICPTGWRLPEYNEWQNLIETTGFDQWAAAPHLKAVSEAWMSGGGSAPENTTGFSALPAGKFVIENPPGSHGDVGQNAYFWSEPNGEESYYSEIRYLGYSTDEVRYEMYNSEFSPVFLSVRCVKTTYTRPELSASNMPDVTHNSVYRTYYVMKSGYTETGVMGVVVGNAPNPTIGTHLLKTEQPLKQGLYREVVEGLEPGTTYYVRVYAANERDTVYTAEFEFVTDTEPSVFDNIGNKYPIVTIGDMEWMGSNLRTNQYNNNQLINGVEEPYPTYTEPYEHFDLYGMYYQHGVVTDPRGICPNGWGIPRREDWQELIDSLGGLSLAGKELKSDSVNSDDGFWSPSATPGTNSSGFNAMPAGYYHMSNPMDQTVAAYFWSRYQTNDTLAVNYKLSFDSEAVLIDTSKTEMAFSVRCIKDRPAKTYPVNVTMNQVLPQSPTSVKISAKIVDSGNTLLTARGFYYGIEPDPTTYIDIPLVDDFENIIGGLTPATVYNFKATATNELGEVFSNVVSFETQGYTMPSLGMSSLSDTSATSVQCWSSVVTDGNTTITARGFVWGTTSGVASDTAIVGGEIGEMSYTINDLEPATTYYIRAYATNSQGTVYGDEMVCTTSPFVGMGTVENPYEISNLNSLIYLSEHSGYWGDHFKQTANIDARTTKGMNSGIGFSPIGTPDPQFTGSYHGGGYYIDSLYIVRSAENYIGLFGHTFGATIKKINLTNTTIKGSLFTGGIVGNDNSSTIDSCTVTGEITGNATHTGGIVGIGSTTIVQNSHFSGDILGINNVGGIIGYISGGSILQCSANGNIIGNDAVGGAIGYANTNTTIQQNFSFGTASAPGGTNVGGLVGFVDNCITFGNNYSNSRVSGNQNIGGLIGQASGITNLQYSYSTGEVHGSQNFNGFVGISSATPTNNYWDIDASGIATSPQATGLTNEQMQIQSSFAGWDFATIWSITEGETYPYLRWQGAPGENNYSTIVKDIDGNVYHTTKIGEQVWFTSNLKTTKLNTGGDIWEETSSSWVNLIVPAYCAYDFNNTNFDNFGALYNWTAVETDMLCPIGWRVSADEDWNDLKNYLINQGQTGNEGEVLKKVGAWVSDLGDPYNFSAIPGGGIDENAIFGGMGTNAIFWTESPAATDSAWGYAMYGSPVLDRFSDNIKNGFSVRCIKNISKFSGGDGTEGNPYQINTLADLNELANSPGTWDKHFQQNANINAAATEYWHENKGWKPIGTTTNHFTGTYDGNGHSIDSLYINRTDETNVGLFGFAMNATLKNLTIKAQNLAANGNTGTLVGNMNYGVIDNCHANAEVTSNGNGGGVLIGVANSTTISHCSSVGSVSSDGWCGGLIGSCYDSNIQLSFSASNVNGNFADAGGFIGNVDGSSEISNCYATGAVSTTSGNVGGFIRANNGAIITNCYSTGTVTGESFVGGFIGENTSGTYSYSYWDTESSGQEASDGGQAKTNLEMSQQATFEGWDFTTVWSIDEEVTTPWLKWQNKAGKQNFTRFVTDTEGNRYKIAKIGSQVWMRENLRADKFNNGTDIALVEDNSAWGSASTPAYCYWDNNPANKPDNGALYNGFAVSTGNLCPVGWRVPTQTDWETLNTFISANYSGQEGEALKITTSFSSNLDDPYGFSALPAGYRSTGGDFYGDAHFWTSTEFSPDVLYYHYLQMWVPTLEQGQISSEAGHSVRCIRNETKFSGGDGSEGTPFQLSTLADLNELAQSPETWDKHFMLTNDIDATQTSTWHAGEGWQPIGNITKQFTGVFNGNGKTVANLFINRVANYQGFFGNCVGATISNLGIVNVNFTTGAFSGALSGDIYGNTQVIQCYSTGIISATNQSGGLVGYTGMSQVRKSYSTVNISGSMYDIGGLVGKVDFSSVVENCYATGYVYAPDIVGGLVGRNEGSTISNSYSMGIVSQNGSFGGLVGMNNGTLTNSFWNMETSEISTSGAGIGLTNNQLGRKRNLTAWDFTNIWQISKYETYPYLQWQITPGEHNQPNDFPFAYATDYDGNRYGIINIGSQQWLDENLKTTYYWDESPIAFEYPNLDPANDELYGKLYTFNDITAKNPCPSEFGIPEHIDWKELEVYLGIDPGILDDFNWRGTNEGGKLKEKTTQHWNDPNNLATDELGFTALPAGYANDAVAPLNFGTEAHFWTKSAYDTGDAIYRVLSNTEGAINNQFGPKTHYRSVRCIWVGN